jgi:TP901 family phage tail tape measure protein
MAELVSIKVVTSGVTAALADLTKLKSSVDYLNTKPIKIQVQAVGVDNVTKEMVKYANAQAKITASNNKLAIAEQKVALQRERNIGATQKQTTAQQQNNKATKEATGLNKLLGDSLKNVAAKMVAWQLMGTAVATAIKSFKEALATLREVDQQLTNIQKVSNLTAAEIKKIGDSAYDTASKYGVAANEYLEAVYTFQKAGLGDSAEEMAELATKVMLVGDTTSAVATKFLVSANAAWKLGGNIQALTKLVDEADYINNNYATTLEDIATGLPIVGAAAAQVGMSAEQTMAAIGTIVASTGQSASKAATALRAIIMNIIGQTGELEDGTKVTEETIKSFTGVLEKYAGEALAAARATGQILDPMEAVSALAKAAEDGFLNEAETFEVLAGLGGKLRTTQLTALVNAQEMYNKMLNGTATAAGTADREVGIMLESWNAKAQILKNTWTEFVSHIVNTRAVKGALNVLTGAIKVLDSGVGKAAVSVAALAAAFALLQKAFMAIATSPALTGNLFGIFSAILSTTAGKVIAVAGAVYGLAKAFDALIVTQQEHLEKAVKSYENYKSAQSEIDQLNEKIAENNRLIEEGNAQGKSEAYINRLKTENELLDSQLKLTQGIAEAEAAQAIKSAKKAFNKESNSYLVATDKYGEIGGTAYEKATISEYIEYLFELARAGNDVDKELTEVFKDLAEIQTALSIATDEESKNILETIEWYVVAWGDLRQDIAEGLPKDVREAALAIAELDEAQKEELETTEKLTEATQEQAEATQEAVDVFKAYNDAIDSVQSALSALTAAQEEYNETGSLSVDTVQSLLALDAEYLDALIDENGQINLNSEAVSDLIDGKNVLLERLAAEAIATYAVEEAQRMTEGQYGRTGSAADTASSKMANAALAMIQTRDNANAAIPALKGYWAALYGVGTEYGMSDETFDVYAANVDKYAQNVMATLQSTSLGLGGWSSKGSSRGSSRSGSSGSTTDTELQTHKNRIDLLKQELAFLEASGASTAERVAKMREIQAALHDEAEYLKTTDAYLEEDVTALKDVKALSTEWWKYQNDISKALEETKESYEDIKDAAIARIDAEEARVLGPLQEQLENLKAQRDAMKDEREEEERLLEVEKARIALENAQKERNVRQYNAATGQWEWVANAANVSAAQENLAQAEQSLSDFYADRKIDELEAKIASIQNDYSQQRIIAEMQANSAAWFDADDATRKKLAAENLKLGTEQGWTRGADGVWYDANGNPVYDGGGILHGVGGIKATRGDEMVLPPNMTARLLTAEATGAFDALLNHLGIVTSAANAYAGFGGGITKNSIGEQHNGDTFYIDGVMMQNITESTTLGQLARTARTLNLCKGA